MIKLLLFGFLVQLRVKGSISVTFIFPTSMIYRVYFIDLCVSVKNMTLSSHPKMASIQRHEGLPYRDESVEEKEENSI